MATMTTSIVGDEPFRSSVREIMQTVLYKMLRVAHERVKCVFADLGASPQSSPGMTAPGKGLNHAGDSSLQAPVRRTCRRRVLVPTLKKEQL